MIIIMQENFAGQLIGMARKSRRLAQGDYLFRQSDAVHFMFIVESGSVELLRHQADGSSIVVQRAGGQTILAEASLYSEVYHCNAVGVVAARVFELPRAVLVRRIRCDDNFAHGWSAHLAREVQSARMRCEILTQKTVAERLTSWLDWQGGNLAERGQWKSIAAQIGVSPEALYRELAKRRRAG